MYGVTRNTLADHMTGRSKMDMKAGREGSIPVDIKHTTVDKVIMAVNMDFPLTKQHFLDKVVEVVLG